MMEKIEVYVLLREDGHVMGVTTSFADASATVQKWEEYYATTSVFVKGPYKLDHLPRPGEWP